MNTSQTSSTCSNCNEKLLGSFCYQCGQRHVLKKLSIHQILVEIKESALNLERGLVSTLKNLILDPRKVIFDYIEGKRGIFTSPFRLMILAMSLLAVYAFFFDFNPYYEQSQSIYGNNKLTPEVNDFLTRFSFIMILPIIAVSTWIFCYKKGINYAGHLVLNVYYSAFTNICLVPVFLLFKLVGVNQWINFLVPQLFSITYVIYFFNRIFNIKSGKSILIYLGSFVLTMVIVFILAIGVSLILYYTGAMDAETLRQP